MADSLCFAALLFDCDGVLVDTTPLHRQAFLHVFQAAGLHSLEYAEIAGLSTSDACRKLLNQLGRASDDAEVMKYTRLKQSTFLELSASAGEEVYPHWKNLFQALAIHRKIAVVSSASRASLDRALDRCGIRPFVELSLSAEDVAHAKPHPEPYRTACEKLGVLPAQALVIEDAKSGIESGVSAGCGVLGCGPIEGPLGNIPSVKDLLAWLEMRTP